MDTDVVIVGAGPAGLMLAGEMCLAGVRPLVLERRPDLRSVPKANGLSGRIVELLHYRGLLDRLTAASRGPIPAAPRLPFGGVHVDFAPLGEPPLPGLRLAQSDLERVLDEHARALGAVVRRGRQVLGMSQSADGPVSVEVRGPGGATEQITARYVVGCDGARSTVRDCAGLDFPGVTYPEVNRLAQVAMPESVALRDDGELEVPGLGRIRPSFIRTGRGSFGIGALSPSVLMIQTTEDEHPDAPRADPSTDEPLTLADLRASIRRVLGTDIPLGKPIRLSRYQLSARQATRYRAGRVFLAGDAAHVFPATGVGLGAGMLDAVNLGWKLAADIAGWAPAGLLDTYHDERHGAGAPTGRHCAPPPRNGGTASTSSWAPPSGGRPTRC